MRKHGSPASPHRPSLSWREVLSCGGAKVNLQGLVGLMGALLQELAAKFLLRDRDSKFCAAFDGITVRSGSWRTPPCLRESSLNRTDFLPPYTPIGSSIPRLEFCRLYTSGC